MTTPDSSRWAVRGLAASAVLVLAAALVPVLTGVDVFAGTVPPLLADWHPRVGASSLPALVLAALTVSHGLAWADRLRWPALLFGSWALGAAWMLSLALVDGPTGISGVLEDSKEYLETARATTDVDATLSDYVTRIPFERPDHWPVHLAGHPPGALLFFVLLVRLGLGAGMAAGLVVVALAASTPAAVAVALRELGAAGQARLALPFLVLGPAAIWQAVSADAVFAAVAAWGLAALAAGAVRRSLGWSVLCSVVAGLLLGYCVLFSYGLPLLGILALAVLWCARSWRPLPVAAAAALAVVLAFAAAGFSWWEAYPVLRERYWVGIARLRPGWYWLWGNLAALVIAAGPVLGAGLGVLVGESRSQRWRASRPVVPTLVVAAAAAVLLADASMMSKSEVERIWLPFVPWLLLSSALLPQRWRRPSLAAQALAALLLQHLLWTTW